MSVQNPAAEPAYGRGRVSRLIYDQAAAPALVPHASARSAPLGRPAYHHLTRWLAVGALALVTILFLLIVLQ